MKKERLALFLGALIMFSMFVPVLASAQIPTDSTADKTSEFLKADWSFVPQWVEGPIKKLLRVWENGEGLAGVTLKYLVLIMVIILVYSSMSYVKFPEGATARLVISIVVGFLATIAISQEELLAALNSYTALGMALIIFLPLLILGFFTIVVASKASPMGIYLQKIIWLIYAVFLFIKSGIGLWANYAVQQGQEITTETNNLIYFFAGNVTKAVTDGGFGTGGANVILMILLIVSIAVFIIMVWGNKPVIAWLAKEKRESEAEAQKSTIERSKEYDKARSDAMQNQ